MVVDTSEGRAIRIVNKPLAEDGAGRHAWDITERRRASRILRRFALLSARNSRTTTLRT
jgi:hypothetical protein